MKRIILVSLFLIFICRLLAGSDHKLVILHTNDLHSRLNGFAPESTYTPLVTNNDKTEGGFARIAGIIRDERTKSGSDLLVLDAGDFMMGTLFPGIESKTGFQLRLMKKMGYDAVGLGNHEFDFGPEWLAKVISKSVATGEIPAVLSGNTVQGNNEIGAQNFFRLIEKGIISRHIIIEKGGLRIGVFSIIGEDAAGVAPNAKPVKFANQVSTAREQVAELKAEKCDLIIMLSHSGVVKTEDGKWGGEDVVLAKKVKGLNLIIGGHTHTKLEKPVIVNGVQIVQAGEFGKYVGKMSLSIGNGSVKVDDYCLIPVDDKVKGVEEISRQIEEQKEKLSSEILHPLGLDYSEPVAESSFLIEGNATENFADSNLGPLVADAINYFINKNSSAGSDVSIVAAGMLFDRILPGVQSAPDLFRVVPLGSGKDSIPGYPLARVYVTGKELKSILEILQIAYKKSPDNYCYFSGIKAEYDPKRGFLKKILKLEIIHPDGSITLVSFSRKDKKLYSITADSYMLQFIGILKKMSFGLINVVPKNNDGTKISDMNDMVIDINENAPGVQQGKEWLALISYLKSMNDLNGNSIPDIDPKYSAPVRTFIFTGAR
jgi:5'-nucleotidase / UDP-sugar diphosphatase